MNLTDFFQKLEDLQQSITGGKEIAPLRRELTEFLIREYAERIATVFYRTFSDEHLCLDLTQELYLLIFLKLHQIRATNEQSLCGWIATAARNLIRAAMRAKGRVKTVCVDPQDDNGPEAPENESPYLNVLRKEVVEKINEAAAQGKISLNPLEKRVWELWLNGHDSQEIHALLAQEAEITQKKEITYLYTRVLLCRAGKKVTEFLEKTGLSQE